MFSRPVRQKLGRPLTARFADLEDALGVVTLFAVLFLGLTLSGVA